MMRESGRKRSRGDRAASDGESCFSRLFRCVRRRFTGSPTATVTPTPTRTDAAAAADEEEAGSRKRSRAPQEAEENPERALRRQRTGDAAEPSDIAPVVVDAAPGASNSVIQWLRSNRSALLAATGVSIANSIFVWRFVLHGDGDSRLRVVTLTAEYVLLLTWTHSSHLSDVLDYAELRGNLSTSQVTATRILENSLLLHLGLSRDVDHL